MAAEYQHTRDAMTGEIAGTVYRYIDSAFVPDDPANRDRAEYDRYTAEGGVTDPPPPAPEPPAPAPDANARIDAGAQAAVETYQAAPMPPPSADPTAPVQGGLPEIEARLARLETTLQKWVEGQMTDASALVWRKP